MIFRRIGESHFGRWLACIAWIGAMSVGRQTFALEQKEPGQWENAIRAFEEADKKSPPPKDAILFAGSSSIRLWELAKYFPGMETINRGFGGSHIADSLEFMSRIIIPCRPKTIVFYAGDNDLNAGKSPDTVLNDFKAFVNGVHRSLPKTQIIFIAIKPSPVRAKLIEKQREANRLIREFIKTDERLVYLDVVPPMLGPDGQARAELFRKDMLHLNDEGCKLWTSLLLPHLETEESAEKGKLRVATCQFPVSADVAANAEWIHRQMREAAAQHADIVHFPEAALSGYAGTDFSSFEDFPWTQQRDELEAILRLARELRLWVVLGSAHRLSGKHKPHNALYVISPEGKIVDRYDKRFCTDGDLQYYSPGDHFVAFEVNGVRCGLLICYDIRFPELYRQYCKRGVRLMFHSFYNARQKPAAIHSKIMPPTGQAQAASNNMFVSMNNSCAPHSWESLFITPDGLIEKRLTLDQPRVMVNVVDTKKKYYDASAPYRLDCINGKWNSGEVVDDPRSRDRKSY